jgi:hypothetical protein
LRGGVSLKKRPGKGLEKLTVMFNQEAGQP